MTRRSSASAPLWYKDDIADYRSIHPSYGTLDDFKQFLDAAHACRLQVIIAAPPDSDSAVPRCSRRADSTRRHDPFAVRAVHLPIPAHLLAFGLLFGGIVLALALAVGLGAKDVVGRALERQTLPPEKPEDKLDHI
jgi:hypothetical protein